MFISNAFAIAVTLLLAMLSIQADPARASAALNELSFYPEGPTTVGDDVLWVEMTMDRVRRLSNGTITTVWQEPGCGPTSIEATVGGSYWVLCHLGHKVVRLSKNFAKELEVASDTAGHPIAWPNDCIPDSKGRLFVTDSGTFSLNAPPEGYVVLVDWSGGAKRIAGPIRYANGISWDEAHRILYVSEHLARRILKLELDPDYKVIRTSVFFNFNQPRLPKPDYPLAGPDGQLLLKSGELIVAEYGAGRIVRIAPNGSLAGVIPVPMKFVTDMTESPFDPHELIVTGAFDNETFPMVGRVLSVRYRD